MSIFPPIYRQAVEEIERVERPVNEASSRMDEAADELMVVASQLRTGEKTAMPEDMAASIEEIADLL